MKKFLCATLALGLTGSLLAGGAANISRVKAENLAASNPGSNAATTLAGTNAEARTIKVPK